MRIVIAVSLALLAAATWWNLNRGMPAGVVLLLAVLGLAAGVWLGWRVVRRLAWRQRREWDAAECRALRSGRGDDGT